jgi:hypothetical protein
MEREVPIAEQAAAALAALQADRERLAERVRPPWWYDAGLGLVIFAVIASTSLRDVGWWQPVIVLLSLVGLGALASGYRRSTGVWVSGLRSGRTRRVVAVWVLLVVAVAGLGYAGDLLLGWRWATVVAGAVLGVAITLLGRWWTRVYVAEIRELG